MKIIDDPSLREKIKIFRDRVDAAENLLRDYQSIKIERMRWS
jgi:hypothetical protein